jgi:hypothetical protein
MQINLPGSGYYMPDYDQEKGRFLNSDFIKLAALNSFGITPTQELQQTRCTAKTSTCEKW